MRNYTFGLAMSMAEKAILKTSKKSTTLPTNPESTPLTPQKKASPAVTRSQKSKASRNSTFSPRTTLEKLRKDVKKGRKRWDEFDG